MRLRLILSFALVVLVSITSLVLIARQGNASELRAFMYQGGMNRIDDTVRLLEEYYASHGSWEGAVDLLSASGMGMGASQGFGKGPGNGMGMAGRGMVLADSSGQILADSSGTLLTGELSADELAVAFPLQSGGATVGYLLPMPGLNFTQRDEQLLLSRLTRAALIGGLVAGAISLLLASYLAYRLLRPVRELTHAASLLAQGDLSQRVGIHGSDELSTLGRTFNQMADSLQNAQDSRRAMTADIAHELRTPLAVQRANLEALQDGIYPLSPENLTPVLDQNLLLTRLVEDLRILALADAGQLKLEPAQTDLRDLLERVAERFHPQATAHQVVITLKVESAPPLLWLDAVRIEQVLNNLLSNALRHTPPGGSIALGLTCTASAAQITVHDSGPGIPPQALPQVFERFYRLDQGRSRAEGGSGLGLAIARQLAEAHGGTLVAANHPQGGALFTLTLPLSSR